MKKNSFKEKYLNWCPSITATLIILVIPFIIYALRNFYLDNDFWFLINTGKEILNHGFINIEPFTIHQGLLFIPQQWLTDVIFYIIYNTYGIKGMFIFILLLNIIIVYLLYKLSYKTSQSVKISMLSTSVINLALIISTITTRPQTFDIIFLLIELLILEEYVNTNKYIYILPILSLLLINFHSSMWLMLFVFLLPYYAEYIYKKIRKQETFKIKKLLISTAISLLCGFMNPYGFNNMIYLFNSYGIDIINENVFEMMSLNISKDLIVYIYIFILLLLIYFNKGKNKPRYILLFLGTTYLALSHFRGIMFLLIISALIINDCLKDTCNERERISSDIISGLVLLSLIVFILCHISYKYENTLELSKIADYLDKENAKDKIIFTNYNDGNYIEYRGYKCYIDARAEVFLKSNNKKENILTEYSNFRNNNMSQDILISKYNFDYIVDSQKLFNNPKNYELVYEINGYRLYKKMK